MKPLPQDTNPLAISFTVTAMPAIYAGEDIYDKPRRRGTRFANEGRGLEG